MSEKKYQALVERVKRKIGSPAAQSKHCVEIERRPDDAAEGSRHSYWQTWALQRTYPCPLDDTGESVRLRWNSAEAM